MRPACGRDSRPWLLCDGDSGAMHGAMLRHEMARQSKRQLLDLARWKLLGKGEDRVLLRVGRHDVAVVTDEMRRGEVSRERHAHRHVLDAVKSTVLAALGDADDVSLRLSILIAAQDDAGHPYVPL